MVNDGLKRVRVFVSSPGDVQAERKIAEDVLGFLQAEFSSYLCIDPLFWENEVQFAHNDFQGNIEPPSQSDLFICILWSRLGTRLHPRKYMRSDGSPYLSGTEFEFEDAVEAFKKTNCPHLMLFKNEAQVLIPEAPPNEYAERTYQRNALHAFFEKWTRDEDHGDVYSAGFNSYKDLPEFKAKITKYLRQFFNGLLPSEVDLQKAIVWKDSPFRGLEHFDYEHAPIFKGRAAVTGEILIRLKQQFRAQKPFMLIGGSSGVGKSSLVRAGLLRLLLNQSQEWNTAQWRYVELRPSDIRSEQGESDFADVLARSLTQERKPNLAIVDGAQSLRTPPSALPELLDFYDVDQLGEYLRQDIWRVVADIKNCLTKLAGLHSEDENSVKNETIKPEVRICLLLDQMEEFFTTSCNNPQSINDFFQALRVLVEEKILVVIGTIRADYLGLCEEVPDLQFLKDGNSYYHLSPPSKIDISSIIREPAQAAGVLFESNDDSTLDEIIRLDALNYDSLGQGTTVLPLLEFTLTELYEKAKNTRQGEPTKLTFEHYNEIGGLKGAIANKADAALKLFQQEFPTQATGIFSHVMRCLVTSTQEGVFSRQKTLRENLDSISGGKDFVDAFIAARLFSTDTEEDGKVTVSIVHEALLQHWQYFRNWLEHEREYFAILQRVQTACTLWQEENESKDVLLPEGKSLRDAEFLRNEHGNTLSAEELRFIAASKRHAERQKRRLYMLVAGLCIGFTLAVFMFYQAKMQEEKAVAARDDAEKLIEFMLIDLRDKLTPLGQLPMMDVLYKEVEKYYTKQEGTADPNIVNKHAILLTQQGDVLSFQGRNDEALELYKDSLAIRRNLVAHDESNIDWQRNLSIVLGRIGNIFITQGNINEALQHYQENLKIGRKLVAHNANNMTWKNDLSVHLITIGDILESQGKYDKSLQYFQESLEITRELVAHDASSANWQRALSISLDRIGDIFVAQGKNKQALQHYQESLLIRRKLVARDASNMIWQGDLSIAFDNIGDIFAPQGKNEQALQYYQESLLIRRKLVAHDANNMTWKNDLTASLQKVGDIFILQGKNEQALQYYQESLEISRTLVALDVSNVNWQKSLYIPLERIGNIFLIQGEDEQALQYYQEALEIIRKLVAHDVSNTNWQRDLSVALSKNGDLLRVQGKDEQALKYYQESLDINRKLVAHDLSNMTWKRDLSVLIIKIGDIFVMQGKDGTALKYYKESLKISRKLVAHDASNTTWQRDLSVLLIKIGDIFKNKSENEHALQFYNESLELRRKLVAHDASDTNWQNDLSIILTKVGVIFILQGKNEQALQYYQENLKISRKLVEKNAKNMNWQRNLSVSLAQFGDILTFQGKHEQALQYYQESLEIRRNLVVHDASNTTWKSDLSKAFNNIGDVFVTQDKNEQALQYYQKSLDIRRELVANNAINMTWQHDLFLSYTRVGYIFKTQGNNKQALQYYQKSLNIIRKLIDHDENNTMWQWGAALTYFKLTLIHKESTKKSESYLQEAIAILRKLVKKEPSVQRYQKVLKVLEEQYKKMFSRSPLGLHRD